MCDKAAESYAHVLEFNTECFKIQKNCDRAVNTFSSTIQIVPEC